MHDPVIPPEPTRPNWPKLPASPWITIAITIIAVGVSAYAIWLGRQDSAQIERTRNEYRNVMSQFRTQNEYQKLHREEIASISNDVKALREATAKTSAALELTTKRIGELMTRVEALKLDAGPPASPQQ